MQFRWTLYDVTWSNGVVFFEVLRETYILTQPFDNELCRYWTWTVSMNVGIESISMVLASSQGGCVFMHDAWFIFGMIVLQGCLLCGIVVTSVIGCWICLFCFVCLIVC